MEELPAAPPDMAPDSKHPDPGGSVAAREGVEPRRPSLAGYRPADPDARPVPPPRQTAAPRDPGHAL
jgi:hypothetical protein